MSPGHTGGRLAKGHENDEKAGASLLWGKAEDGGAVWPGEKAQGDLLDGWEGAEKLELDSSWWLAVNRQEGWAQIDMQRVALKHKKETDCKDDQTVGQVGQRAGNPGNTQNLWKGRKGVEQGGEHRERGVSALTAKLPTPPGWERVPLGSCTPS